MQRISNLEFQNKTNNILFDLFGLDVNYKFTFESEPVCNQGKMYFIHTSRVFLELRLIIYKNKPKGLTEYWETKLGFIPKPTKVRRKYPSLPNTDFSITFESIEDYENKLIQSIKNHIVE